MIICGTGHRPDKLGGYGDEAHERLVSVASTWIAQNSPDKIISGMALGWDIALADAALRCGVPLLCAIPFEGQESRWPRSSQERFLAIRSQASEEVVVSEGAYAPWKMQIRNRWMVDNCDLVVAMWDGSPGGTGNCVKYTKDVGRDMVNLYEELHG